MISKDPKREKIKRKRKILFMANFSIETSFVCAYGRWEVLFYDF